MKDKTGKILAKDETWYCILIGRFSTEEEAKSYLEKLHKPEGYSDMIIRDRSPQN